MLSGKPAVLRSPDQAKQETIAAVKEALEIIGQRMIHERVYFKIDEDSFHSRLRAMRSDLGNLSHYVQFAIGRSQQPLLKGRMREWRVSAESRRIALETGASYEDVYKLFMSLMSDYIRLRS